MGPERFELSTTPLSARHSTRLSYGPVDAMAGSRTRDTALARPYYNHLTTIASLPRTSHVGYKSCALLAQGVSHTETNI